MKILPKQTIVWDLKLLYTTDVVEKINCHRAYSSESKGQL